MHTRFANTVLMLAIVLLSAVLPASASHIPGQEIVAEKAISALPGPLRSFMVAERDGIVERAIEPDGLWRRESQTVLHDDWHFLMLDGAVADAPREERLKAVATFSSDRTEARRQLRAAGITRGGQLPWRLESLVERLSAAFVEGDKPRIIELAGQVVHFSADAGDAFCCTVDPCGGRSGNVTFGALEFGSAMFAHQDVSHRLGWELVRRNAQRYSNLVDARGVPYTPLSGTAREVLDVMVVAYGDLDQLREADRKLLASFGVRDEASFDSRCEEYYQLLDEQCGAMCADVLARGATLAAGLIGGAWERAGSPLLDGKTAVSPAAKQASGPGPSPTPRATPSPPAGHTCDFVASKNSKVYHRSDCTHAKRINAENLVHYGSAREAELAGKRPCRTCRPDESQ